MHVSDSKALSISSRRHFNVALGEHATRLGSSASSPLTGESDPVARIQPQALEDLKMKF
jgi:hypothetical protein